MTKTDKKQKLKSNINEYEGFHKKQKKKESKNIKTLIKDIEFQKALCF